MGLNNLGTTADLHKLPVSLWVLEFVFYYFTVDNYRPLVHQAAVQGLIPKYESFAACLPPFSLYAHFFCLITAITDC